MLSAYFTMCSLLILQNISDIFAGVAYSRSVSSPSRRFGRYGQGISIGHAGYALFWYHKCGLTCEPASLILAIKPLRERGILGIMTLAFP